MKNYTGLSQSAIDLLNDKEPNRTYMVTWDNDGDIIELKVMGASKPKASSKKSIGALDQEFEHLIDTCVNYTKAGSMVIAFELDLDEHVVVPSHPLGTGYVVYNKKPNRVFNTLDDAIIELIEHAKNATLKGELPERVLRYKRRQNKWYSHTGEWYPELNPAIDVTSKDSDIRAYDLEARSHIWEDKTSPE